MNCAICTGTTSYTSADFAAQNFDANADFDWSLLYTAADDEQASNSSNAPDGSNFATSETATLPTDAQPAAPLAWLWDKAVAEWKDLEA